MLSKPDVSSTMLLTCTLLVIYTLSQVDGRAQPAGVWQPEDMSLDEWKATWGQGYKEHKEVMKLLNRYAELFYKRIHPGQSMPHAGDENAWGGSECIIYTLEQAKEMVRYEELLADMADGVNEAITGSKNRRKRAVGLDLNNVYSDYKWTLPIPYKVDAMLFTSEELVPVRRAISEWQKATCVSFDEKPLDLSMNDTHHILFSRGGDLGCYTFVGSRPEQPQPQLVHLSPPCVNGVWGLTAHELGHVLGLYHEQSRPDRGEYIKLDLDNVLPSKQHAFAIAHPLVVTAMNTPYDYGSLMQYRVNAFGINTTLQTIIPRDSDYVGAMGQVSEISFYDAMWVNRIYCADVCTKELNCQNGGYTDPNNCSICRCPTEWSGPLCEDTTTGSQGCSPTSGEIKLSEEVPMVCVNSPNFDGDKGFFTEGDSCTWVIKVPTASRIKMWTANNGNYLLAHPAGTCVHWLELKYTKDHIIRGHRLCGSFLYDESNFLTSSQPEVTAIFRSHSYGPSHKTTFYRGFQMCFQMIDTPASTTPVYGISSTAPPVDLDYCVSVLIENTKVSQEEEGIYTIMDGVLCGRRPAYKQIWPDEFRYLYSWGSFWIVSSTFCDFNAQLFFFLRDISISPDKGAGLWQEFINSEWENNSDITANCNSLPVCEHLLLSGYSTYTSLLGVYVMLQDTQCHYKPVYQLTSSNTIAYMYFVQSNTSRGNFWRIGPVQCEENGTGYMLLLGGTLTPDRAISNWWEWSAFANTFIPNDHIKLACQDKCSPNPCEHGTCDDEVNGYTCSCDPGWAGTNCDADEDECSANNGGCEQLCLNSPPGSFTCVCQPPYIVDDLDPSKCIDTMEILIRITMRLQGVLKFGLLS